VDLDVLDDSVAIIAVDSAPHVVQPLTPVNAPEAIASKALQIESMGGGIFVYEALVAAGKQLLAAPQATKHIILFSDAADSEVPGDYVNLLADYRAAGITVSVIGLGTRSDVDAALLKDIAAKGDGSIAFTENAEELPRLFTEDTLSVARGTFVEADPATQPGGIGGDVLPGVVTLGPADASLLGTAPPVGGYNLTYLRPGATPSARSRDEYAAPWAAHWYRGLGRAAAITVELDGPFTGAFDDWEDYASFLVAHARWLIDRGDAEGLFVDVARAGQDGVVTIELDRPADRPPEVLVVSPGGKPGEVVRPELRWDGPSTLTARFPLKSAGAYRTVVRSEGGAVVRGPVVSLPYSTELAPRTGRRGGLETLRELASSTGGVERFDLRTVFEDLPRTAATVSLTPPLLIATLVLLVVEIAGRRLDLWRLLATRLGKFSAVTRTRATPRSADAASRRAPTVPPRPARAAIPREATPPRDAAPPKPAAATRETGPSVFEKAKRKAAGRTGGP
ncbi:MAG: vWA domain-containing protein, partial [Planctomycetota bacterium]